MNSKVMKTGMTSSTSLINSSNLRCNYKKEANKSRYSVQMSSKCSLKYVSNGRNAFDKT